MRGYVILGAFFVVGLFVLSLLFGCWFTVEQGESAAVLSWGAFAREVGPGGPYGKNPVAESVVYFDHRQQKLAWDAPLNAYTADTQQADVTLTVVWHVPAGKDQEVLNGWRDMQHLQDKEVEPAALTGFKNAFGAYASADVPKTRAKLALDAQTAIQVLLAHTPVVIDSVNPQNVQFRKEYEVAVEAKAAREQEMLKEQVSNQIRVNEATAAATATRARADAEAYAAVATAKARAEATQLQGEAEGKATAAVLKARADALNQTGPGVLALTLAERWDGKLPVSMIPGSALPMLQLPGAGPAVAAEK